MRTKSPKDPPKFSNVFDCCDLSFDGPEAIKKHLQEVHGITEFKGTRTMQMHLDCSDHHVTSYEWTIGSVKFAQCISCPRKESDGYYNPTK